MKIRENSWKFKNFCDFREIPMKLRDHIAKWNFREAETPKSAKSTKPYKLLGQIDGISYKFHFLKNSNIFIKSQISAQNVFLTRTWFRNVKAEFPAARASGKSIPAYVLCFKR